MEVSKDLVVRAQAGDFAAYGRLVEATQTKAYAVAYSVLRDRMLAEDATQEAYIRAFRNLTDLSEPAAFQAWLRRIVVTVAMNLRRRERLTLLRLDDVAQAPVLDEEEASWTEAQRHVLARALLVLTKEERRLCDRRYYGACSIARLAEDSGVDEGTLRKRLQRIRDKLRKEIEMAEQQNMRPEDITPELPARIVELLARPRLSDLPENPVGKTLEILRTVYLGFEELETAEIIDFEESRKTIGNELLYVDPAELHRLDARRILRYDLTLPLLLSARYKGRRLQAWTSGKVYRICQTDSTHLEAFHQAEALWVDKVDAIDPWRLLGQVIRSVDLFLPGAAVRIVPTRYPMCTQAWEIDVDRNGQWFEVAACGVFIDKIVKHLGGEPGRITVAGAGYGLERLAMLRYDIDDIRRLELASVGG